jgi:hypothetical protein
MAAVYYRFIRPADALLILFFIGIAWFGFGVPWEHTKSSQQGIGGIWYSRLCRAAIILAIVVPIASLMTGSLITKYGPERIDGEMAKMVLQAPTEIGSTTFPRASSPEVSRYVIPRRGSYVAAATLTDIGIGAASPVLMSVLGEIDWDLRVVPTWTIAAVLSVFLVFLWVHEIGVAYRHMPLPKNDDQEPTL